MTSAWHWVWFHAAVAALLGLEWLLARRLHGVRRRAAWATALWVAAALGMALALLLAGYGASGATQFLAGYALEQSLSIDNLFVFLLLFRLFQIPDTRQQRVLFWGVAGAMLMRGVFVAVGIGLLQRFHWVEYILGALLLFAAARLLRSPQEASAELPGWLRWLTRWRPISPNQDHFFVQEPSPVPGQPAQRMATVLLLALVAVELTDIVFALDSIPAVLSITRVPFLAYSSNILAVMGLRSLYILLADALQRLRWMHIGLAAVLAFAALKMLVADWVTVSAGVSLAVIASLLAATIAASLWSGPAHPAQS